MFVLKQTFGQQGYFEFLNIPISPKKHLNRIWCQATVKQSERLEESSNAENEYPT